MNTARAPIIIRPRGRLANQMFQLMLAIELSRKIGGAPIFGYSLPEWGLIGPSAPKILATPDDMFLITRHRFRLENLLFLLQRGITVGVVIEGWGMRHEYYSDVHFYRKLFQSTHEVPYISDKELLINVRAEDILSGFHPHYYPMAFSYFEKVIAVSGLQPVFMGQIGEDNYSLALKKRFKGARFLPHTSAIADFQTIRKAYHIALGISSFSWLAAWLSESALTIHMPFAGLFEPQSSGENLVPIGDHRYRYYKVPFPSYDQRKEIDLVTWAEQEGPVYELAVMNGRLGLELQLKA